MHTAEAFATIVNFMTSMTKVWRGLGQSVIDDAM